MTSYIFEHEGKQFTPDGRASVQDSAEHNKAISRAEVEWFTREKPSRHFAYVKTNQGKCECPRATTLLQAHASYPGPGICPALRDTPIAVTTWTGEKLGDIVWCGRPYKMPAFGGPSTRQNLRIQAINGLIYSAIYYKSSGDYCRMKVISSSKRGGRRSTRPFGGAQ